MAIDKASKADRPPSPRSVSTRYFHVYDHRKTTPSILRRKMRYSKPDPFEYSSSAENNTSESRTELESQSAPMELSSPRCSPPERILKIIMPTNNSAVPSSFSPPPNKIATKKVNTDIKETSGNRSSARPRNTVRFHSKVLVMRIPSHNQYPRSIKRNLWCSLSEIARSAQRNTIEFSSEGWDWRSAVEEENMYIHPKSGKYIHPVHYKSEIASNTNTTKRG